MSLPFDAVLKNEACAANKITIKKITSFGVMETARDDEIGVIRDLGSTDLGSTYKFVARKTGRIHTAIPCLHAQHAHKSMRKVKYGHHHRFQ